MPNVDTRFIGLRAARANLAAIRSGDDIPRIAAARLYRDASVIMAASQRLCPVLTGNLRSSGHVDIPVFRGPSFIACQFGYGGPAAGYAIYAHENLTARHTNGTAKFLEIPYLHYIDGSLNSFADELRAADIFGRSQRLAA